jgi:hypothetical protein
MSKETEGKQAWITVSKPSYLGKNKDDQFAVWDKEYGLEKWRLAWQLSNGEVLCFEEIFQLYVESYTLYFLNHHDEAFYLTENFSYAYDKDLISKEDAFNPYCLYNKPGRPNQFHNVALNIALEIELGLCFKGLEPIQVREGKPNTDVASWPLGWRWSPGQIPAIHPELIPPTDKSSWWRSGSIEELYQSAKVLQIKV